MQLNRGEEKLGLHVLEAARGWIDILLHSRVREGRAWGSARWFAWGGVEVPRTRGVGMSAVGFGACNVTWAIP